MSLAATFAGYSTRETTRQREGMFTLVTLFFLCATLVLSLFATFMPSAGFAILATVIYIGYMMVTANYAPFGFVLLLPYMFLRATMLISGIAIESGGYMHEITMTGFANGSFLRLTMYFILFIYIAAMIIQRVITSAMERYGNLERLQQRITSQPWYHMLVWIFLGGIWLTMLYIVVAIGLTKGFPLLIGADRFVFRADAESRVLVSFFNNRLQLAGFLGLICVTQLKAHRVAGITTFFTMLVVSILFGEKFTSLVFMLLTFAAPLFLMRPSWRKNLLRRMIILGAVLTVLTIPLILLNYGWAESSSDAMERAKNRVASQGQVWFLADRFAQDAFSFPWDEIVHNASAFYSAEPELLARTYPFIGAQYFMATAMPSDMLGTFWNHGISVTMAFEGYLLHLFGWFGMILPFALTAIYYSLALCYFGIGILSFNPIRVILAGRLLLGVNFAMMDGLTWFLFGWKTQVLLFIILLYEYWMRAKKFKTG